MCTSTGCGQNQVEWEIREELWVLIGMNEFRWKILKNIWLPRVATLL